MQNEAPLYIAKLLSQTNRLIFFVNRAAAKHIQTQATALSTHARTPSTSLTVAKLLAATNATQTRPASENTSRLINISSPSTLRGNPPKKQNPSHL